MRVKWSHVRAMCLLALGLCVAYGAFRVAYPATRHWSLWKEARGLAVVLENGEDTKRLFSATKAQTIDGVGQDGTANLLANKTAIVSNFTHDINTKLSKPRKSAIDILWVVPVKSGQALDLVLQSLHAFEHVLVSIERVSTDLGVVSKYDVDTIVYPYHCRGQTNGGLCYKNHWWWAVQKAWNREPAVLCVIEDDAIVHPDAKKWLLKQPLAEAGVRLAPTLRSPWCFGRELWSRMEAASDAFCMSEHTEWDAVMQDFISQGYMPTPSYVNPSNAMALQVIHCNRSSYNRSDCTLADANSVKVWVESKRYDTTVQKGIWTASGTGKKQKITLTDYARCKGLCEGFQFLPEPGGGVHINQLQTGAKAYMIDLGAVCIDSTKVKVSFGGEEIKSVLGRAEEDEFAQYETGAWRMLDSIPSIPTQYYQQDIADSVIVVQNISNINVKGTTIAFQRNEYANLWHNTMDLFNLYLTLQHTPARNVLWLDGHAVGNLDDMWTRPFGLKAVYVGQLNGVTCFERVVLMPKANPIYEIDKFGDECSVGSFVQRVYDAYSVTATAEKHDTVIVRGYYLAHPRQGSRVERTFSESDLATVRRKLPRAKFVQFHELTLQEQLQTIANTKTLYGIHGAGCTFGMFLSPGSKLVEWVVPSRMGVNMFVHMMTWRPDVAFERINFEEWLNAR